MANLLQKYELKYDCSPNIIKKFLKELFSILENYKIDIENLDFRIELAVREILANAVEHPCYDKETIKNSNKEIKIVIKIRIKKDQIFLSVKDSGKGFDWKNYDFQKELSFEENGRGLKMINDVVDKLEFNKSGNKIKVYFFSDKEITKK